MATAYSIAMGNETIPNEWIDLITDDPKEREQWRIREFRKGLK